MRTPESLDISGTIPPDGGWKKNTYYVVDVAHSKVNVIHKAILYTGFMRFEIYNGTYEDPIKGRPYYLKAIEEIYAMGDKDA